MKNNYLYAAAPVFILMILAFSLCGVGGENYDPVCPVCGGSGACQNCQGTGKIVDQSTNETKDCFQCGGTSNCKFCGGDGRINKGDES